MSSAEGIYASIRPSALPALTGDERFSNGDRVLDFWRWAIGDLRMNNARGYLAEFLVARAVKAVAATRVEWAGWDVKAPDGTRIEVKSSGYLQSWTQKKPSRPEFGVLVTYPEKAWDEGAGADVLMPEAASTSGSSRSTPARSPTPMTRSTCRRGASGSRRTRPFANSTKRRRH